VQKMTLDKAARHGVSPEREQAAGFSCCIVYMLFIRKDDDYGDPF
jgi:hypothetical protein